VIDGAVWGSAQRPDFRGEGPGTPYDALPHFHTLHSSEILLDALRKVKTGAFLDRFMKRKSALNWWPYIAIAISLIGLLYINLGSR
jgi:hypothetical protein